MSYDRHCGMGELSSFWISIVRCRSSLYREAVSAYICRYSRRPVHHSLSSTFTHSCLRFFYFAFLSFVNYDSSTFFFFLLYFSVFWFSSTCRAARTIPLLIWKCHRREVGSRRNLRRRTLLTTCERAISRLTVVFWAGLLSNKWRVMRIH